MFLADSIQGIYCRWVIDDFIKYNNNNFITSLIMNMGAEFTNHIEKFLIICYCQINQCDCPDLGNINYIKTDVISLSQKIIRRSGQEAEKDIDIDYIQNESNLSYYHNFSTKILELTIDEIIISEEHLTKVEYNRFDENIQAIILCDIIQD